MLNSILSVDGIGIAGEDEMDKYTAGIILGILGAGAPWWASCPAQAPIVLEYNLAGPAAIESETITAAGTIKTICVTYEFTGQVSLEASANGGAAYTKIINGQPLVEGFIPGNQLRLRAVLGPQSSLKKLVIGYSDSSGAQRLYRNPDLANYKNQREIYISGGSQEVFNYPLKIDLGARFSVLGSSNLSSAEHRAPSTEVYFTAADGQTPLYYYEEGGIASAASLPRNDTPGVIANPALWRGEAIYWVKIPQIPQEGTRIYVYYGGVIASPVRAKQSQSGIASSLAAPRNDTASAEAASEARREAKQSHNDNCQYNDGDKVFPFFEDFSRQSGIPQEAGNGAALNEEKWEIIPGLKKEYEIKDGYLRLKDCLVVTRNFKTRQGILEFKAKAEENAGIQVVVRTRVSAGLSPDEQIVYSSNYPGAEHTIAINNIAKVNISKPIQPLTDYIYKATLNSTGILFERYSEDQREKQAEIKFLDVENPGEGYIGLKADAAVFNAGSVYFDWIRFRPYVEVEPAVK